MVDVRGATVEDVAGLCALLVQLPVDSPGDVPIDRAREVLPAILAQDARLLLVACDGDRIVGTTDVIVVPNLTHGGKPYANVENVVVDASVRGQGIGRALMEAAIAHARAHGCYKVGLTSNLARTAAHQLYESLGFEASAHGYRLYFNS
jgi:GNAT superfamily N-acetyltransferase